MDTYSIIAIGDKIQTINEDNNENEPFFLFGGFQVTHTPVDFLGDTDALAMVNEARQQFCKNVLTIDAVFGDLMIFLKDNDQWDHTMIVTFDNGAGRHEKGSSNYFFLEGGIRTVAFIRVYVPENQRGSEGNEFIHVVDWVPALLSLSGADMDTIDSDLQSILNEPMAEPLTLSTYGATDKKSDGYDLPKFLIYGSSKFDTDSNDITKIKSGKKNGTQLILK